MTDTAETMLCHYCGWPFAVTPRHRAEKVVPYCSLGCRRLSEERHVAHEAKKIQLVEDLGDIVEHAQAQYASSTASLADLPEEYKAKLLDFLDSLIGLTPAELQTVLLTFQGKTPSEIARLKDVSAQAAHKAVRSAERKMEALKYFRNKTYKEKVEDSSQLVIAWN